MLRAGTSDDEIARCWRNAMWAKAPGHASIAISERHGARMADLLQRCSFLPDEAAATSERCAVTHLSTDDVLPPFARG
ncbi:hypothetical protein I546_6914 [Mycobacterium kansasii 732]|uniref:hypothetical protein n=1 Tax=Mycobacterium pseudokansasii TaxID=2341080 RepID=UPI00044902F6|nr:hypothetical protein [Mycobacterium pseudokansasii]ETZ98332.1 hypothetical protein I546_6914 [Mycobacterium kansasii 732]KZS64501.1 hypothetical protein A4G27_09915 [Mycobacterium kansasii]MBY0390547.1 hypothetical protein [Mycobacterium pseudokansasii]